MSASIHRHEAPMRARSETHDMFACGRARKLGSRFDVACEATFHMHAALNRFSDQSRVLRHAPSVPDAITKAQGKPKILKRSKLAWPFAGVNGARNLVCAAVPASRGSRGAYDGRAVYKYE